MVFLKSKVTSITHQWEHSKRAKKKLSCLLNCYFFKQLTACSGNSNGSPRSYIVMHGPHVDTWGWIKLASKGPIVCPVNLQYS